MKIPRETLDLMNADTKPSSASIVYSSLANSAETEPGETIPGVLAAQNPKILHSLARNAHLFLTDESGRGIAAYGIVIAVVLLACGVFYGLREANHRSTIIGCSGCGMG